MCVCACAVHVWNVGACTPWHVCEVRRPPLVLALALHLEAGSLLTCFCVAPSPTPGWSLGFQTGSAVYLPIETLGSLHPDFLWSLEI